VRGWGIFHMVARAADWLPAWLDSLELELDVPVPAGVAPDDSVLAFLEYAWRSAASNRERLIASRSLEAQGVTVRHGWQPQLPVFTVEWEQVVEGATAESFIDMNLKFMAEQAAEWDTTFLGAEYLAEHGSPEDLSRFARLVRWRFKAAPLQDREMLYIVVPYRGSSLGALSGDGGDSPLMIAYISVRGRRYPPLPGHTRARNLVPSFDLCDAVGRDGGGMALRIQHCMTTHIGGSVPDWVWNRVFKSAVLTQNESEALHVRGMLQQRRQQVAGSTSNSKNNNSSSSGGGGSGDGSSSRRRRRVLILGFGDSGLATAVHLAARDDLEVVGVSSTSCHYSAQELGGRLAQPSLWKKVYLLPFETYSSLDRVRIVHGLAIAVDVADRCVSVQLADGSVTSEGYDALLISTGVSNGFWRGRPVLRSRGELESVLQAEQQRIDAAATIVVVGGGPSGVSAAYNLQCRHPTKAVHLFVSGGEVLPRYHASTRARIAARLAACGVSVHPNHRAAIPADMHLDQLGSGTIAWKGGQPAFEGADVILWAIGSVQPNNAFLPADMLTTDGFVAVDEFLRVRGHDHIFAVGDIAATDAERTSARNNGWALVGHNITASLSVEAGALSRRPSIRAYRPPTYRWGSILGPWDGAGYEVHFQNGYFFWVPLTLWNLFWPLVQRFLWAGMRNTVDWKELA
jgi:NADH dehydrogenase FAD-containing subunit